jgi:hypothetical protein
VWKPHRRRRQSYPLRSFAAAYYLVILSVNDKDFFLVWLIHCLLLQHAFKLTRASRCGSLASLSTPWHSSPSV